jgi:diadenosine tetraphosphate (Ap4A) HIT family hydrolase
MNERDCPFCGLGDRVLAENAHAVAVRDFEPASTGHTLIIPKRHVGSFFDLSADEVAACHALLRSERDAIAKMHRPDGYNIGINEGETAGQSVPHTHWHLIPRYRGDHPDPRGGVRHVIPTRR